MGLKTGTIATATDTVVMSQKSAQDSYCLIQISGTYTGLTFIVEGVIHSTGTPAVPQESDYTACSFVNRILYARDVDATISTTATGQLLEVNGSGLQYLRVRATALASGSATVTIYSDDVSPFTPLGGG